VDAIMQLCPLENTFWKKFRQSWAKFGQIWAKVIKIVANLIRIGQNQILHPQKHKTSSMAT